MAKKKDEQVVAPSLLGVDVEGGVEPTEEQGGQAGENSSGEEGRGEFDAEKFYGLLEEVQEQLAEQSKALDLLKPETVKRLEVLLEVDITPIEDVNERLEELEAKFEKVAKWAHRQGYRA
ncbi:MAG: hypothetical protein DWQ07_14110 [Chloroflexi bacterium]|nr:MAG: hypothetical protein DWQ07_14110 [Chloroflexota bacterium]